MNIRNHYVVPTYVVTVKNIKLKLRLWMHTYSCMSTTISAELGLVSTVWHNNSTPGMQPMPKHQ